MSDEKFSIPGLPPQIKKLGNNIGLIAIVVIALIIGFGATYQVGPEEAGMVIRLGKYDRTVSSGLHFKIPFAEDVFKVPVERQLKHEFGFRTVDSGVQTRYSNRDFSSESLMLTGDLNLGNVEWVVQYRISDPYQFLFKVRNPEETLRDISEAAMREIVGDRTVNEVLTVGRAEVAFDVQTLVQELCSEYNTGITVEQIVLQDVNPPEPVKPSFNAVNEAQQERETLINEAKAAYNRVVPRARGQAQETIQKAEGYAINRTNRAEGEIAKFEALYGEYLKAPSVTKKRIYLETMEEILPNIENKIIVDDNGNNVLPLLQMQLQKGNQN